MPPPRLTPLTTPLPTSLPPYPQEYPKEPSAITRLSFARVREICPDLKTLPAALQPLAVRMIHACGNPEILPLIRASKDFPQSILDALSDTPIEKIPVLCDSAMLRIAIEKYAPHAQCLIHHPSIQQRASKHNITKAMAAIDQYCENNDAQQNNVVAKTLFLFGAAPTALLRLLEHVREQRCPKPKAVFAFPVGFVSAVESKQALLKTLEHYPFPAITLLGRLGGSAIAAAAFNATFEKLQHRKA